MKWIVHNWSSPSRARYILIIASLLSSSASNADTMPSDWRTDYKLMCQAYYAKDDDKASTYADSTLNQILLVQDQTEKEVALDLTIRMLGFISANCERQQNYSQQETVLKNMLKAQQAKNDDSQSFQIKRAKQDLGACLVLEGKNKEAEVYLSKAVTNNGEKATVTGWRGNLDLLSRSQQAGDLDDSAKYGAAAVDDALSVKNTTEKTVALDQIIQQLQSASYRSKRGNDYPNQEKILKLILRAQEGKEASNTDQLTSTSYQSVSTMQQLATCLVMQGKDKEAETYDARAKEITARPMKESKEMLKNFQDQLERLQQPKNNKEQI